MTRVCLITPEIGRDKGGIQNWMYYVKEFLAVNGFSVGTYAYREDNIVNSLKLLFCSKIYFLATWKMSILVLPFIYLTRKKVFVFVHGNEILNLNAIFRFLLKALAKRNRTYFVANSQAIGDLFRDVVGLPVDYIQHPFMEINPKSKNSISMPTRNTYLTITRLVKRKNIDSVIRAFKELELEGFDFTYYVAGDGKEYNYLVSLIDDLSLTHRIKFFGKVTENEKNNLYAKSNYFLLPSLFDEKDGSIEGYGITFIEANSYGIPVLSGNTGGMKEAVINGVTGLHCDGSIQGIKEAILKISQIDFSSELIFNHAVRHDYLNQIGFIKFVNDRLGK